MVHLTGIAVSLNGRTRQRCAWCGALLVDGPMTAGVWNPLLLVREGSLDGIDPGYVANLADVPDLCTWIDPQVTA